MVQVFIKRCFRILHFEALLFVVKSKWKKSSLEIFFVLFKFWKLWENFFTAFIPWIDLIKIYTNSLGRCQKVNPLSPNLTKWSNILKLFIGNLPTNCLSVFGHFVGLALKVLIRLMLKAWNMLRSALSCLRIFLKFYVIFWNLRTALFNKFLTVAASVRWSSLQQSSAACSCLTLLRRSPTYAVITYL